MVRRRPLRSACKSRPSRLSPSDRSEGEPAELLCVRCATGASADHANLLTIPTDVVRGGVNPHKSWRSRTKAHGADPACCPPAALLKGERAVSRRSGAEHGESLGSPGRHDSSDGALSLAAQRARGWVGRAKLFAAPAVDSRELGAQPCRRVDPTRTARRCGSSAASSRRRARSRRSRRRSA